VLPNLDRIAAVGDQRAVGTLAQTPQVADEKFLATIGPDVALDLARYGIRQTTIALRHGSIDVLTDALWATALGAAASESADQRDLMIGLALPQVVAREVGSIQRSSSPRSPTAFPTVQLHGHSSSSDRDEMSTWPVSDGLGSRRPADRTLCPSSRAQPPHRQDRAISGK
jgi:hypothetical protein